VLRVRGAQDRLVAAHLDGHVGLVVAGVPPVVRRARRHLADGAGVAGVAAVAGAQADAHDAALSGDRVGVDVSRDGHDREPPTAARAAATVTGARDRTRAARVAAARNGDPGCMKRLFCGLFRGHVAELVRTTRSEGLLVATGRCAACGASLTR